MRRKPLARNKAHVPIMVLVWITALVVFVLHSLRVAELPTASRRIDLENMITLPAFTNTKTENNVPGHSRILWKDQNSLALNEKKMDLGVVERSRVFQDDAESEITAAICYKTMFGKFDIERALKWVAYNRLLGFDHIFMWYLPGFEQMPLFDKLASLPFVTVTEYTGKYQEGSSRGSHYGQDSLVKQCLQNEAREYTWVYMADVDEYLWFDRKIGLKNFLAEYNDKYNYLSFGKYMYTNRHEIALTEDAGFGLDRFSYTAKSFCVQQQLRSCPKCKRGSEICPTFRGRCKLMVKPDHYSSVAQHGGNVVPDEEKGQLQFNTSVAHIKEWRELFDLEKIQANITMHAHPEPVFASTWQEVEMHQFPRGYRGTGSGDVVKLEHDSKLHEWMDYVANRGSVQNNEDMPVITQLSQGDGSVLLAARPAQKEKRCALLFFGLPRSYRELVLPSIEKNLLMHNKKCDVYAHSIVRAEESGGRSGRGGQLDPDALLLLSERMGKLHNHENVPNVAIATNTEDDFWRIRNATIQMYRTAKANDGKTLYFPYKPIAKFSKDTVDNIVRQWHSIQAVWKLMEREGRRLNVEYDHVGMFRSDVFFATPIDISNASSLRADAKEAVVAGFSMYPVNDRMIYGPHSAVKIWATERFERLVTEIDKMPRGLGMHPETFLDKIIFPAIEEETGVKKRTDPDICFFRVRADLSLWVNDCLRARRPMGGNGKDPEWIAKQKEIVERMVGRKCELSRFNRNTEQLVCSKEEDGTLRVQ